MSRVNKKEAIELIKKGELIMPGYTEDEYIEYINTSEVGTILIPIFKNVTKDNIDSLMREYPMIEITE